MRLSRLGPTLLGLLIFLSATRVLGHAKPGAHADVRFSITRSAVRMEALMNLRFAEGLVNWSRSVRDEVAPEEEAAGRAALLEYFGGPRTGGAPVVVNRPNSVTIDGVPTQPLLVEFRVVRPAPETRPGFVEVAQAQWQQVLVVVEYPCKTPPRSVGLVWGTYPRDFLASDRDLAPLSEVEAILIAEGETSPITFREHEPEYVWHASATPLEARFQKVPSASAQTLRTLPALSLSLIAVGILAGATLYFRAPTHRRRTVFFATVLSASLLAVWAWPLGRTALPGWLNPRPPLPSPSEALAIFQPLQANIYRAFDYTAESEIYDALARSVDGPLLAKTYDDIYRSLILHEEGGALCRVKSVHPVSTEIEAIAVDPDRHAPQLTLQARWRVEGVVYHWGHSHSRINEYRARYTVATVAAGWRITGIEPMEQRRVESEAPAALPKSDPP